MSTATLLAVAAAGAIALLSGCGGEGDTSAAEATERSTTPTTAGSPVTPTAAPVPSTQLTAVERSALRRMREEEKLARDVYAELSASSGDRRFANIGRSEQQHFDLMGELLQRYGMDDPSAGLAAGDYRAAEFRSMHAALIREGSVSRAAAITQGVLVERTDIADIDAALPSVTNPELRAALLTLRAGSERHLAAFSRG